MAARVTQRRWNEDFEEVFIRDIQDLRLLSGAINPARLL
jgi:hypothetical protein